MNKKRFYKTLRNIGGGLMIAGLMYIGYQIHKGEIEKNEELKHKYAMNAFYGLIGTMIGAHGVFILGQHKLNKLEKELKNG